MNNEIQINGAKSRKWMIQEVLEGEFVTARYQPIISIKRKALFGFEGLSRGIHPHTQALLPPLELFAAASYTGVNLRLDRLCRKKVLEQFKAVHEARPEMMLTLNFDGSLIDQGMVGSGHLSQMVKSLGLNPWNICIEIIESNVRNTVDLQKFVNTYRRYGFLIALDGVNADQTNLNRVSLLKPDMVKIDRSLVQGIQNHPDQQKIYKSLVFLCETLGTQIVAEGVETKEEALTVLQLGTDMIQGAYFAKPMEAQQCLVETYHEKINDLASDFKSLGIQKIKDKRIHYSRYHSMIESIRTELSQMSVVNFDVKLEQIAGHFKNIECLYVLDARGIQVTKTFYNDIESFHQNRFMFRPAPRGTDHTIKDYYYVMMETGLEKENFVTEPYLSLASGNRCVTISTLFTDNFQHKYLLCVDIRVEKLMD